MMRGERFFVDTNVLLAATDRSRPEHDGARQLLTRARRAGVHPCMSGQVVREYLSVATRPVAQNGLGMRPGDALGNVGVFRKRIALLVEDEEVCDRLCALVRATGVAGRRLHDANIAATMRRHGIGRLVTANAGDFEGLPEVETHSVADALRALPAG